MNRNCSEFSRLTVLGICSFCLVLVVAALAGCGAQNETIGQGEHELVFTDEGNVSVPIIIRWTSWDGYIEMEEFTVYVGGKVTLKTEPRLSYDIQMRPECDSETSATEVPHVQDEVIDLRGW